MGEWSDEDVENVRGLLTSGSGADEVCAVTGCEKKDLDRLCKKAFGRTFEDTKARFNVIGRAMFNKALFEAACAGNAKAMDMYARTVMGFSPGPPGRRKAEQAEPEPREKLEL